MYSKNKGFTYQPTILTPPPGYDGSRFRSRSDGRDDAFPLYENSTRTPPGRVLTKKASGTINNDTDSTEKAYEALAGDVQTAPMSPVHKDNTGDASSLSFLAPILKRIGKEELIIIALIIILAGERENMDIDTILLLALLLCAGQ